MSRGVLLERPAQEWSCPNCGRQETTPPAPAGTVDTRYHHCPRLRGLAAPMLPAGMDAKVEVREPEDYIGGELVQRDEHGRPVSAIYTIRADGSNDAIVLAPTARLSLED